MRGGYGVKAAPARVSLWKQTDPVSLGSPRDGWIFGEHETAVPGVPGVLGYPIYKVVSNSNDTIYREPQHS
jgi:hypothetical protein